MIFYGPPGTGKTTLARVIAERTAARFVSLNAVLCGVKDIRKAVEEARAARAGLFAGRTILFVDEVHRFNKSQQDALLPWVEDGTLILIGATTENPYFEVNKALVSRSRLFRLEPLSPADLHAVVRRALSAADGYRALDVRIAPEAEAHLVDVANGDARALLNALELAVETTDPGPDGGIVIDLAVAEESIQRRAVLYDREGDAHFDTISAFIKSIRGSDPDAALYWLARMVYAGEDPRFIFRRLIIVASEDVGLAAPEVLGTVLACAQSFDRIGMPEGRFPLAQATLVLAAAPKSNSTMGFFDALASVEAERTGDVPTPLKDPSRDGADFGHGQGYLYPHAYRDHWVAQQYLPEALQGRIFWRPSDQGHEGSLRAGVERRREAQLAAMMQAPAEPLSWSPARPSEDRWLQRTVGDPGAQMARLRELVFGAAQLARHHIVADLNAGSGLLLWEAVRRTPEGHVWSRVPDARSGDALEALGRGIDALRRPRVVVGDLDALVAAAAADAVQFDRIVARDAAVDPAGWPAAAEAIRALLAPGGRAVWVQTIPCRAQRITDLPGLAAWRDAEEALYASATEPALQWDAPALGAALAGEVVAEPLPGHLAVTEAMAERWLQTGSTSWVGRMAGQLDPAQVADLSTAVRALRGRTVPWTSTVAVVQVTAP